jgi:uncharacterized protein (DUF342 family)
MNQKITRFNVRENHRKEVALSCAALSTCVVAVVEHKSRKGGLLIMDMTGINLSETDGHVFLRSQPVVGRATVDAAMLHTLLQDAGFGQCLLDENAIASAAADCNSQQTPFVVQVAERRDAAVQIEVAPDDMAAQVSLIPPLGGKPITIEDIRQALSDAGVVFGIDEAALFHACDVAQIEHWPIASGAQPQDGQDTGFDALLKLAADRAPKVDANGLIDYREHSSILVVHPGEPLMRRHPPTPGIPGHTVKGRKLPPRAGIDEPFAPQLAGARTASGDANLLEAAVVGQPVLVSHGVMVEPVLRLAEVNMATGNIHFDGTVQIDAEVTQGMKVHASGDIVIKGTVDGGVLEAGGDIHVAGGIIARSQVRAQGGVSARFAESSSIFAGTVIALDDMALSCQLESLNQIIIGEKTPQRGRLVGGTAKVMMLLRVPLLGSHKAGITVVKLGANAELEAQIQALEMRLEKEKASEESLQKLSKHLTATGDPKGMLERVKAAWQQAVQAWSKSLAEHRELQEQLALTLRARVEIMQGVDGAADLAFGSKLARLRKEFSDGAFSFDPAVGVLFTDALGITQVVAAA